jgi:hypothetical protein
VRPGVEQLFGGRGLRRPALFVLTAILCLFSQAAVIAHTDFADHGVCEHGELTELTGQSPGASTTVSPDRRPGLSRLPGTDVGTIQSADEHCVLAQLVRQLRQPTSATGVPVRSAVGFVRLLQVESVPSGSLRPLDVSPKQGPPA